MIRKHYRIFLSAVYLLFFLLNGVKSQTAKADSGKVEYIQDSRIGELMNKKVLINEKKDAKVKGYRVQIHFGSDREKAKEIKAKFLQAFNSAMAYEKYEQPNFKIRVGDFRTRTEAFKFLKEISPDFPSSFIVQDEIELKELVK
ncbi:MAG: SPOR domain-containing protein [Bacteroidia bacterium]|nr:SPOR domain-containing protein [Bacteroidia bacterium]